MGNAARDTFSKKFTADKMIAATQKVYLDLGA